MRDFALETPAAIDAWVRAAAADPVVKSVILFGSRSTGRHRPNSDWDIALVTANGERPSPAVMDGQYDLSEEHGVTVLGEDRLLAEKDTYATLASEVALGVVLEGEVYELARNDMAKRRVGTTTKAAKAAFAGLMEQTWVCLRQEIMDVANCRASDYARAPARLGGNSADAAERVVKMVTLSLGKPFLAVHDIHELADDLPGEWRGRVKALNGNIHRLHMANYGEDRLGEDQIQETCETIAKRLRLTMDVLTVLCEMENPLDAPEASRLLGLLTDPGAQDDVATMTRRASDPAPELARKFESVRNKWLAKLHRLCSSTL